MFDIGSITKQFTKAAILKLEAEGKLELEAPLTAFFETVSNDKKGITVAQLINHEAGLRPYVETEADSKQFGEEFGDFIPMDREGAIARILNQELLFAPGTAQAYSNSGYTLLAAIVEIVSGQFFEDYVRQELLKPAGLSRTGFYGQRGLWEEEEVAVGYEASKYGSTNSPYHWPEISWVLKGAGGMVSSVAELYRWIQAVRTNEVLPPESINKYYKGPQEIQAYTGGNNFGFIAHVIEVPEIAGAILVTSNADSGRTRYTSTIALHLAERVLGRSVSYELGLDASVGDAAFNLREEEQATINKWGLPRSPAGYQSALFLEALARQDEAFVRQFVEEHFSTTFSGAFTMDEHLEQFRRMWQDVGRFELVDFNESTPDAIDLIVQSLGTGMRYQATVMVERDSPYRVVGLLLDRLE